jgi:hypothetical protein
LEQLFRGHQHHNDQSTLCQVLGLVSSTVQPIPATLLTVASLVTMVVFKVVCTVFVISRQRRKRTGKEAETRMGLYLALHLEVLWIFLPIFYGQNQDKNVPLSLL